MSWIKSFIFGNEDCSETTESRDMTLLELVALPMSSEVERLYHQALQDNSVAIFKLALRFYKGLGVEKNHHQAYKIFRLLWDEDADAEFYMGEICREVLINGKPDYHQACCHYAAAMEMGNAQAKQRLRETAELSRDEFWLGWCKD